VLADVWTLREKLSLVCIWKVFPRDLDVIAIGPTIRDAVRSALTRNWSAGRSIDVLYHIYDYSKRQHAKRYSKMAREFYNFARKLK
jgi:HEPN domain-containing protein